MNENLLTAPAVNEVWLDGDGSPGIIVATPEHSADDISLRRQHLGLLRLEGGKWVLRAVRNTLVRRLAETPESFLTVPTKP